MRATMPISQPSELVFLNCDHNIIPIASERAASDG